MIYILVIPINVIAFLHYFHQIDVVASANAFRASVLYLSAGNESCDTTTTFIHSSIVISMWALLIYTIKTSIIYIQFGPDPFTDALQICVHVLLTIANIQLLSTMSQLPVTYL